MYTYSDDSTLSNIDLFSVSLAVFPTDLKTILETAAAINLLTTIQNPNFDAHLFNI